MDRFQYKMETNEGWQAITNGMTCEEMLGPKVFPIYINDTLFNDTLS